MIIIKIYYIIFMIKMYSVKYINSDYGFLFYISLTKIFYLANISNNDLIIFNSISYTKEFINIYVFKSINKWEIIQLFNNQK